jgi:hypothetical protein
MDCDFILTSKYLIPVIPKGNSLSFFFLSFFFLFFLLSFFFLVGVIDNDDDVIDLVIEDGAIAVKDDLIVGVGKADHIKSSFVYVFYLFLFLFVFLLLLLLFIFISVVFG